MAECPETKTVIDLSHELTAALSSDPVRITTITRALVNRKLIQNEVMLEMLSINDTPTRKAAILVGAVISEIEATPVKFTEFVEILLEQSWVTSVVENLCSIYQCEFNACQLVPSLGRGICTCL